MDTLISSADLAANLDHPQWCIIDCRFSLADSHAGQRAYDEGHIPGAVYLNLEHHLSAPHVPGKTGRHPLPDREDWVGNVQALGISPDIQVVAYDDAGGAMAARLWWMLRWIGHEKVAVLDGGLQGWLEDDNPVTGAESLAKVASTCDYLTMPSLVKIVAAEAIDTGNQYVLDARELPRYRGDTEPLDPVAGHIPGAHCSPFSGNLDGSGRFLPAEVLKEKFSAADNSGKPVVCYCGSGVTAAHNIFAMKVAGLDEAALYPGSWSEWVTDPDRGIAKGG